MLNLNIRRHIKNESLSNASRRTDGHALRRLNFALGTETIGDKKKGRMAFKYTLELNSLYRYAERGRSSASFFNVQQSSKKADLFIRGRPAAWRPMFQFIHTAITITHRMYYLAKSIRSCMAAAYEGGRKKVPSMQRIANSPIHHSLTISRNKCCNLSKFSSGRGT